MRGYSKGRKLQKILDDRRLKRNLIKCVAMCSLTTIVVAEITLFRSNKINSTLWRVTYDINSYIKHGRLKPSDLRNYFKEFLLAYNNDNEIPRMDISLDYKNIISLECQRRLKIKDNLCKGYKQKDAKADIIVDRNNYKVRLRAKGDRRIHFADPSDFSFKADIRGEKRLWGMEEFSIQDPINRNYFYEAIASDALRAEGIVTPRHRYVNLFINGSHKGIKHIEETVSVELIESNKRRYGPTYSLDETLGTKGNITYEVQDRNYWEKTNKQLMEQGLDILNNSQNDTERFRSSIDLQKWASFFAFIDAYGLHHGSAPKSVKFYLNPVYGKIEPIFFDGHRGAGYFKDFLLLDFVSRPKDAKCEWICANKDFYQLFFGTTDNPNTAFISDYLKYLKRYSSQEYLNSFLTIAGSYSGFRGAIYRALSRADSIFHRSFLPHIFSVSRVKSRISTINSYFKPGNKRIPYPLDTRIPGESRRIVYSGTVTIEDIVHIPKSDVIFEGDVVFELKPGAQLHFSNSDLLSKDNSSITVRGTTNTLLTIESSNVDIDRLAVVRLGGASPRLRILHGGLNFLDSRVKINMLSIKDSRSEDGVNFVDSEAEIGAIYATDIQSDAIDSDFSNLLIDTISCSNVNNDCFDTSFSSGRVGTIKANRVKDKVISAGEGSRLQIKELDASESEMGIVVKDLSKVDLNTLKMKKTTLPIVMFIKKSEFGAPRLLIADSVLPSTLNSSLISDDSELFIDKLRFQGKMTSKRILQSLYGNDFGVKTIR